MTAVRIPPTLRTATAGQRQVDVEGATVGEVLDNLTEQYPDLRTQIYENGDIAPFVNVYLDSEDVRTLDGLGTAIVPGAKLILLPAMAGGN